MIMSLANVPGSLFRWENEVSLYNSLKIDGGFLFFLW